MPYVYKTKSVKSRAPNSKKSMADRARKFRTTARAVYRKAPPTVNRSLGVETKFFDTSLASAISASTNWAGAEEDPAAGCLNAIAQGNTDSNRIGRKVTNKSLHVSGSIHWPPFVSATVFEEGDIVTLAVVEDKQTNAVQLNSEDVYSNPGATALQNCAPLRNLDFSQRFKVLRKFQCNVEPHLGQVSSGGNLVTSYTTVPFDLLVDLNDTVTNFTASTGAVADIVDVSYHVIAVHTNGAVAPTINYNSRLRFVG